jgi:hypothetical protein
MATRREAIKSLVGAVAATLFLPLPRRSRPDAYITGIVGNPSRLPCGVDTTWRFIHVVDGDPWLDRPMTPRRENWLRKTWRRISALQSSRN